MKKLYLLFVAVVAVLAFAFINPQSVKADSATVATVDGASIRTTDPMGLRFAGQVTGEFTGGTISYGFLVSKGEFDKDEMLDLAAASKAVEVVAGSELDGEGRFYASIVNIPAYGYEQKITVLAYVEVDGIKTYAQASATRDIAYVASQLATVDEYKDLALVKRINGTSKFTLNGGEFVDDYNFSIIKCGDFGSSVATGYYIDIATKANYSKVCNSYWTRVYLNYNAQLKCYETVATGSAPEEYDYVLAAHDTCYNKTDLAAFYGFASAASAAIASGKKLYLSFDYPTAVTVDKLVCVSKNYETFFGNKVFVADGEALPSAGKAYYDFDGWFDNAGLTGDPVVNQAGDAGVTYYAKYTPTEYTITYNMQGGSSTAMLVETYNYESAEILLPAPETMSMTDANFLGWFDNVGGTGSAYTSIPSGSFGNKVFYACWEMLVAAEKDVNSADKAVLNALYDIDSEVVDIIVDASLSSGRFLLVNDGLNSAYDSAEYLFGTNLFNSIADAINAANNGDTIYVFAGVYGGAVNVTKSVKLCGPNYGIAGTAARNTPATITGVLDVKANNTLVNGFEFTKNVLIGANFVTVDSCYISCTPSSALAGCNRKAAVGGSAEAVTDFTLNNCYVSSGGGSKVTYMNDWMAFFNITNLTITNNTITNEVTALGTDYTNDGMGLYYLYGTMNIIGNEFSYATNNWLIQAGFNAIDATINVIENTFRGRAGMQTCTLGFKKASAATVINVIGNEMYSLEPATVLMTGGSTSAHLNVLYNYVDGAYKTKITSNGVTVTNYNCYAGGMTTTGTNVRDISKDPVIYSTLEEVRAAYAAYKAAQ